MYHQVPDVNMRSPADRWMKHDRFGRFGFWRAEVINTADPEHRGRVQVRVLHLHPPGLQPAASAGKDEAAKSDILVQANATGATSFEGVPPDSCPWAEPCFAFGGKKAFNSGHIMVPYVGSTVWVAFEMGFSGRPVWFGSWLGREEIPDEIAASTNMADVRLIRTEFGHLLLMNDNANAGTCLLGISPETGDKVRFLEFDEVNKEVRLFNDPANDVTAPGTGTRVYMTEDELILSKGDESSAQVITIDASKIEIRAGTSIVTINKSGDVAVESPGGNITATTAGNVDVQATGDITLGPAAAQGVCLDSLITVIATAYGIFNTHTHIYSPGPGAPTPTAPPATPQVVPVIGTNSSSTVKAKL
jgi:hypothetical protein